ncbi:galactose-3-O-sulfotransferase 2-like [Saccoglossus kowalevskii]
MFRISSNQITWFGYRIRRNIIETEFVQKLQELDEDLDLVMITEYMDESLILLKKMMCWTIDDIVFESRRVVNRKRTETTHVMKEILSKTLKEDIRLYDHFNKTLWQKIQNYDGHFDKDLRKFRARESEMKDACAKNKKHHYCKIIVAGNDGTYAQLSQSKRICGES